MAAGRSDAEEQKFTVFGCWNVGGGLERKQNKVAKEMCKSGVHYLGITETKKKAKGHTEIGDDCALWYNGVSTTDNAKAGVGLIAHGRYKINVKQCEGVNERLLVSEITEGGNSIALFVFYGPDNCRLKADKMVLFDQLQNAIDASKEDNIIIVGDFNARVGKEAEKWDNVIGKEGETDETDSGMMLLQLCVANDLVILNTFFAHEDGQKFTRHIEKKKRGGEGKVTEQSLIDYCIVRRSMLPLVADTRAHDDTEKISDHRLVTMKMENRQSTKGGVNRSRVHDEADCQIRYHLLKEQDCQEKYQKRVSDILSRNPRQNAGNLENMWLTFRNALLEAATEVCGTSRSYCNRRGTSWWSDDVARAVREKNVAWRKYRNKRDDVSLFDSYRDERKAASKVVKKAKRSSWKDFGNMLGSPRNENEKLFFHVLTKLDQDAHYPKQNLKSTDGSLLTDRNQIVERWRQYFKERFTLLEDQNWQKPEKKVGERISRKEMQKSLQRMKGGRSAGRDGISPEMIRYMGEKGQATLLRIINMAWKDKRVPQDWKETIVFPFYRNGDRLLCESYGGISLLSMAAKIYARILEQRIRKKTEAQLNEAQCGYRQNRSKNDHAFVIRQLIQLSHLRKTALHLCHLNLERALGKLPLSVVMGTLVRKHVPVSVRLAVLGLYEERINYVRTGNTLSRAFGTGFSLRPQDSLSSYLSVLVLDDVLNKYQDRTKKDDCSFWPVTETVYFDQVVLLASTRKELQEKLDVWCGIMNGKGLHLCEQDARIMSVLAGADVGAVEIGGSAVPEVPCLSYSGLCIGPDQTAEEFNRRIGDAARLFNAAKHGIVGNRGIVGKRTKKALFDSEYVERMSRGSATRWISHRSDVDRMKSMEDRYLRHSGISTHNRTKAKSVERMRQRQLAYSRRVSNMEEGRAPRLVWETLKSTNKIPEYSWRRDVEKPRGSDCRQ